MTGRLVTSLTNATVKAMRALHMRKEREETGLFLAEGLKIVTEAVDTGHAPRILLYGSGAQEHPLLKSAVAATAAARGEVIEVTTDILAKISRRDNPQAVLGVFDQTWTSLEALDPHAAPCWVALQAVRDPGNLGTIIRTADSAGCGGVILVGDCVDPFSVEAVRATMGSVFAVKIAQAGDDAAGPRLPPRQECVVGTHLQAAHDYRFAPYRRPTMILMGNEQAGLPDRFVDACDLTVKIPMRGRADSLNLSVATGIMVYAAMEGE